MSSPRKFKAAFNSKAPVTNYFAHHLRRSQARARLAVLLAVLFVLGVLLTGLWQVKCCQCLRAGGGAAAGVKAGSKGGSAVGLERKKFIFIYDLGPEYTDHILQMKPDWYSHQYDVERLVAELLLASNAVRTTDPLKAALFFLPVYSARFTLAHFHDKQNNMREAVEATSQMWARILTRVRADFPFFNRSNGRDHFAVLTMDHGRCHALTFVHPELVGEMFFVTYNGDRMVRSTHANKERNMQAITYNYGAPVDASLPDIPCFLEERDVVVPVLVDKSIPLVLPVQGPRDITALFRFAPGQHHGVPISHHNHQIRRELVETYRNAGIPGWDFAVKSEWATNPEWQRALFCICPPGHSQWTSRPFKSLISGCIPVTFFREHVNPWSSDLDYSSFSINIDPADIRSLQPTLEAVLRNKAELARLQQNVAKVQRMFRWTDSLESGAAALLLRQLRRRAQQQLQRRQQQQQAQAQAGPGGEGDSGDG